MVLQNMMGWEMVRFETDRLELLLRSEIGVTFFLTTSHHHHSTPSDETTTSSKVTRVELKWKKATSSPSYTSSSGQEDVVDQIERFFFDQLADKYHNPKLLEPGVEVKVRVFPPQNSSKEKEMVDVRGSMFLCFLKKDHVHDITSIWTMARELIYEFRNAQQGFKMKVEFEGESKMKKMKVLIRLTAKRQASGEMKFEFNGEEILDPRSGGACVRLGGMVRGMSVVIETIYGSLESVFLFAFLFF